MRVPKLNLEQTFFALTAVVNDDLPRPPGRRGQALGAALCYLMDLRNAQRLHEVAGEYFRRRAEAAAAVGQLRDSVRDLVPTLEDHLYGTSAERDAAPAEFRGWVIESSVTPDEDRLAVLADVERAACALLDSLEKLGPPGAFSFAPAPLSDRESTRCLLRLLGILHGGGLTWVEIAEIVIDDYNASEKRLRARADRYRKLFRRRNAKPESRAPTQRTETRA